MNETGIWIKLGMEHVLDPGAWDHLLFLFLLCVSFPPDQWKKLLILVTGFTAGHSASLALSVAYRFSFNQFFIEFLIALTIFLTAAFHLLRTHDKKVLTYLMVSVFGLVHGLGFSTAIRELLGEENFVLPLFFFNVGLEIGQIAAIVIIGIISLFLSFIVKWQYLTLKRFVSVIAGLISLLISSLRLWEFFQSC